MSRKKTSKHDEYKKIQEKLEKVKLSMKLNKSQKEIEFNKIFSSLDQDAFINIQDLQNMNSEYLKTQDDIDVKNLNENEIYMESLNTLENEKDDAITKTPDESGVLTYDEVKDIITYYEFKDLDINNRFIFSKNDYKIFNSESRSKYMNIFFNQGGAPEINKSYSTKDSSSNKKNFTPLIKLS